MTSTNCKRSVHSKGWPVKHLNPKSLAEMSCTEGRGRLRLPGAAAQCRRRAPCVSPKVSSEWWPVSTGAATTAQDSTGSSLRHKGEWMHGCVSSFVYCALGGECPEMLAVSTTMLQIDRTKLHSSYLHSEYVHRTSSHPFANMNIGGLLARGCC